MRKIYTSLVVVALCLLGTMTTVMAQTAYVMNGSANKKVNQGKGAIYAFDVKTPWIVNEICYADTTDGCFGLMGTLVDDIYYAYMETEGETGTTTNMFCSLNMTTGKKVILGHSYDLTYAIDMCYEEQSKNIYMLRKQFVVIDEEAGEGEYLLELCTVNPANGRITPVATLPREVVSYNIAGITSDGNGGLYMASLSKYTPKEGEDRMFAFWYKQINLYRYDLATKTFSEVFTEEPTAKIRLTSDIVNSSIGLHEGVLYITAQANLITLDIATKTATMVTSAGSGEAGVDDAKLFLGVAVGICFDKSTADATPVEEGGNEEVDLRKVKIVETYGDHMGERAGQMTHRKVSFYDGENRLLREATYGLSYASETQESTWEIEYFGTYQYNEQGLLAKTYSEKYGLYDGTDLGFIDNRDTITYEYDATGNLVKKASQADGYSMIYEYDEEGRLEKECKELPDVNNQYEGDYYNIYEISYSGWNEAGQPTIVQSTGVFSDSKYYGTYTYDEKGRKIKAEMWNTDDNTQKTIESWTYDMEGDTVMIYQIHEWFYGFDQGEKRTVYTYDNGNVNRIKMQQQSLTDGQWISEPTYTITEVAEFAEETAALLEVTPESGNNTCQLTLTIPEMGVTGSVEFDIYRHGILLTRLKASDAIDGKLTYIDADVKNGTYDYYAQTVLINDLLEIEETANISNVVTYTHNVELPAVTDIKGVAARKENGNWYVTIEWTAPEGMEGLKFQRYNVMLANMKAADNATTDGQATTWEVEAGADGMVELYIQTVYAYGKSNSELITINAEVTGIKENGMADVVTAENGKINLQEEANLTVYNMQGAKLKEVTAATNIALTDLPKGIYLVKIESAGQMQTIKVRR